MVPRQQAQMVKKNRKVHLTFDRKHLGWFPRFFKENVLWTDKPKLQKQKVYVPLHLAENENSLSLKQKKQLKQFYKKEWDTAMWKTHCYLSQMLDCSSCCYLSLTLECGWWSVH